MRSRKFLVIAGFLVTWTYIIFYFMPKSGTEIPLLHNRKQHKLQQLEESARQEYHKIDKLTINLLGILKTKYSADNPGIQDDEGNVKYSENKQDKPVLSLAEPPAKNEQEQPQEPQQDKQDVEQQLVMQQQRLHEQQMQQEVLELPHDLETSRLPSGPPATVLTHLANNQPVIPVLVFACNRVSVSKCLDNLIKYRPSAEQFPIIVSQDCGDEATRNVIQSYEPQVSLIEQPDQSDIFVPPKEKKFKGYYKIARHYGWALNDTFGKGYEYVIIVEDDLSVAPDFYEYFSGTHHLLKQDKSLW